MHGRATRTRAWCGHVHAHGKDMHVRVATNRAGILLAIMRPGQLKIPLELCEKCLSKNESETSTQVTTKAELKSATRLWDLAK